MSASLGEVTVSAYLADTLLWTAVLIALVLVLRRPVTRVFGAPSAYALWALPMLRLVLPPIELPAWLAAPDRDAQAASTGSEEAVQFVIEAPAQSAPPAIAPAPAEAATAGTDGLAVLAALPLAQIALALWLGGAAVFLYRRFAAYFALRAELMQGARAVGSAPGPYRPIRLIETPGTPAPLAFGVLDPVIALPPGFMARIDRDARDLALAHELEHHRGHDLLINVAVQPLFAMHWFNPLGHYGWLALRRDQEAACDARVLAAAPREARALYAKVIASFAAGPNIALAAPMACPVLGDKSIIQRLRNIKMTDNSSDTRSRRTLARLMLGGAVLALPLTASITYAETSEADAQQAAIPQPAAPPVPQAPEAPPAPPAPPAPGEAPAPPQPSEAPEAPSEREVRIVTIDPDTGTSSDSEASPKEKRFIISRDIDETREQDAGKETSSRFDTVRITNSGKRFEEAELELVLKDLREGLADADKALEELRIELKAIEKSGAMAAHATGPGRTVVRMSCTSDSDEVAATKQLDDGRTEVSICQARIMAHALTGLKQAREAIAGSQGVDSNTRNKILAELDQQIASWREETR